MSNKYANVDAWGKQNGFPLALERSQHLESLRVGMAGSEQRLAWEALSADVRAEHNDFMDGMSQLFNGHSRF